MVSGFPATRYALLAFFVGVLCIPASTAHAALDLVSYWNLNETSGTRADSVGSNDLTSVNTTPAVTGYDGNAASFPIASSTYLTINDNASLSTTGSTTFKVSLRVKLLSKTTTQVFAGKYDASGNGEYAVYYEHTYKRFVFSTYSNSGLGNHYVLADAFGEPALDTWYLIEVTHDGLANTNTITVNGTYTNILTSVPKHVDTAAPFRIGAFGPSPTYYAGAVIDDVRFYKAPVVSVPDNLVAYWKFDEGSGTKAVDTAYGDHTGTISGATYSTTVPSSITFDDPYSLDFDGVNDGVSTSLSLNNYSAFTLAGWAYPRTAATGEGWFGANDVFEFFFTGTNGVKCWTPRGEVDWTFTPATFLNRWHHITCLGTGSSVILYVDGTQVASTAHTVTSNYGTGDTFSIGLGVQNGGTSGPFDGLIDDVRVYNRALTPAEMNSLGTGSEEPVNNPTISTFSPADNATGVALSPSLIATFSTTTIATSTGTIGLYTTSGNVLVESIPVTGSRIAKSGAAMTITPSATLNEGTEYYVWIPGTAFVDGTGLYYGGTSASTTWSFTTGDFSGPSISSVQASTSATSSVVTWTTQESASSKVVFGLTNAYGSTTAERDTSPRVTSHSVSLTPLASCARYHYAVVSRDASGNSATSTDAVFTTSGCEYTATTTAATSTVMSVSSGGRTEVTDSGKTFAVTAPANLTASSSSFTIQIQSVPSSDVLPTLGKPSAKPNEVGLSVFNVKAIVDNTTILDSFDAEVTISYQYTDDEVVSLDESSLWLYHYTGGAWVALNSCSLDTGSNTITCTTPSFSVFGLFGSGSSSATASRKSGVTSIQEQVRNLTKMGKSAEAAALQSTWSWLFPKAAQAQATITVRDLTVGMTGEDVRALQKALNARGYPVAAVGAGSQGHETSLYGALTMRALAAYQKAHGITPAAGYFGPRTRAVLKTESAVGLWW